MKEKIIISDSIESFLTLFGTSKYIFDISFKKGYCDSRCLNKDRAMFS